MVPGPTLARPPGTTCRSALGTRQISPFRHERKDSASLRGDHQRLLVSRGVSTLTV